MKLKQMLTLSALTFVALTSPTWADVSIEQAKCPGPVQAVIQHYAAQAKLKGIALDEKKKSGGPAVYEAEFSMPDGRKFEVHISPEGKVLQIEKK